ncbi:MULTISPECIES: BlaI/MecI/CopY family transcriptional regulator [Hyphomonas]|jgi:predicted transcriptional regulator|uniref:CopY family transcriptional regulator n=1 Tax=Hyphomonas jannaschiana VP2 TaxID=1280952 RepID=A0A059F9Z3_9PROT|nr:BlaI/MecI/CopY family transcriptional regulator [Hyphomonas jannaschiana]KCZ87420.1 CopY family transcriptional regulator [Hyphomonas jannaschiana VP2]MCA8891421.1 BlaI/MecI/CopY family transcriptional regulator [Hyphomonas sp.]
MSQPNSSELIVLKHLWSAGPQSAREVHQAVGPAQGWKPSTTRTVIARMEEKGWVTRKDVHGMAVFSAVLDRTATLGGLVRHLARQVLDMDGPIPAALFAESPHLSDAELDELDAIINAAEDETKGGKS